MRKPTKLSPQRGRKLSPRKSLLRLRQKRRDLLRAQRRMLSACEPPPTQRSAIPSRRACRCAAWRLSVFVHLGTGRCLYLLQRVQARVGLRSRFRIRLLLGTVPRRVPRPVGNKNQYKYYCIRYTPIITHIVANVYDIVFLCLYLYHSLYSVRIPCTCTLI